MSTRSPAEQKGCTLPDGLHARLTGLGYRQRDTSSVPLLEEYRLYTAEREGVCSFVVADEKPQPHPLLVTGAYFYRRSDESEAANARLEQNAFSELITSLAQIAWRRLHPSRWQQLLSRHRLATNTAVAVAILSGMLGFIDSANSSVNTLRFVNALSARLGDFGATNRGLLVASTRILFVLATTTLGYWIASLIGARRHPIVSADLSERSLRYCYGPEACRVIDDLEKELKETSVPAPARTIAAATVEAEPAAWRGYDNFVSYEEFQKRGRLEVKRAGRFGQPVSCLIMTLEPAPSKAEPAVGDMGIGIRRECSQLIWHEIREIDTSARYGESGFIILLPNTDAQGAQTVERRLRTRVESCNVCGPCVADAALICTGLSAFSPGQQTLEWEDLIRQAESSLLTTGSASANKSPNA